LTNPFRPRIVRGVLGNDTTKEVNK
jgi:hypothetical protein